jgi:acetyl esterase
MRNLSAASATSAVTEPAADLLAQHPLTPAMRDVLRRMERAQRPHLHTLTPQQARAAYEAGAGVLEINKPQLPRVQDMAIAVRDGANVPARLYAPQAQSAAALPVLLYLHGGGFTIGSIATHDVLCRQLAHLSGCAVVSLDYRLAPEHPFPTAINDAWDALQWLHKHGHTLGLDTTRMAVGGDSAGGTLAAACAILARDAGLPLQLQVLIYPGTCAHQDTDSHARYASGLVLERPGILWFFEQYVRSTTDREDWRFAPLNAPDVEGVAPAFVCLAELDPLVDEGVQYADMLRMAGVPVALEIYKGVTHEFIKMGRVIAEARQAHADMAAALRAALGTTVTLDC